MNISETNGAIATKYYLKHHLGEGKAALGFGPDRIRTLVSMATESSHRVIMEKTVFPLFLVFFFHPILFILADTDYIHESLHEFEIGPDPTTGSHGYRWVMMGKMVSSLFLGCFSTVPFHT